jgi:hypothetical protein
MLHALEPDVTRVAGKALGNGVRAIGVLRTINTSPSQQASDIRGADAKYLFGQNMIDTFLEIGNLSSKPIRETAGDLSQKHT